MKIEHVAIWTNDLERLRDFYITYFNATSNKKYYNPERNYQSYFLSFDSGSRLELMQMPNIPENCNDIANQNIGFIHMAIAVGSNDKVIELTEKLRTDGYTIISEPRQTGDGYFESCILDPDNNRIEITG